MCAAVNAASASAWAVSAAFTCSASSLARANKRGTLIGRRGAHALAGGLLFGAQRVGGRDRGPASRVGCQQRVHQRRVFAAAELRTAYGVGVLPEQLQVDHGRKITFCPSGRGRSPKQPSAIPWTQHRQHLSRGRGGAVRMEPMSDAPEKLHHARVNHRRANRRLAGALPTFLVSRRPEPTEEPRTPVSCRGAEAGRLAGAPLATQAAGDGDQAGAAAHRPRRADDRRAGHRDSRRRHRARAAGGLHRQ